MAKSYKGQSRGEDGRFGSGKQNGSKAKNRSVSATSGRAKQSRVAGVFNHGPFGSPVPNYNPDGTAKA